jgi:hypothetical protein
MKIGGKRAGAALFMDDEARWRTLAGPAAPPATGGLFD